MDEICQCCGMILKTSDDMGRFTDGTVNSDYCRFCFSDGGFTHATMDEQIQCNLQHLEEWRLEKDVDISRGETEIQLREYLPQLKRWLPMEKRHLGYWRDADTLSCQRVTWDFQDQSQWMSCYRKVSADCG